MDVNDASIRIGNWLYKHWFPLYNFTYTRFKHKNDRHEIGLLKRLIAPGDHVLDIGANIGFYARIVSGLVGDHGKVYCFEPDRTNYARLVKNTEGLKNVERYNLAVSDRDQPIALYRSKLLNVDHRTYPVHNAESVEEIQARSIDGMLGTEIERVNLIKIDIQGFELTAFRGMQRLLRTTRDLKILAEYWPHGFKRAGTSAVDVYDYFDGLDYQLGLIDEGRITPLNRPYALEIGDKPFEFSVNVLIEKKR
jgi:FkbM family methyltransferase